MSGSDNGGDRDGPALRDGRGRYVRGVSGNPAGKPRGCLNRATRLAADLLDGEAEALWRAEIELALAGDRMLLRHCNDRIIAPRRGQPVLFAMPPIKDASDVAAAIGAVVRAAARGLVTPAEAESLVRTIETGTRAIAEAERIERERLAVLQQEAERRLILRAAVLLFYGVREIDEEAGDINFRLHDLCKPILRLGEVALVTLAAIPDTPELVEADRAFLAAHPPRLEGADSPLTRAIGEAWENLSGWLSSANLERLEGEIREREAAGQAPTPRYRTGMFERLRGLAA